MEEDQQNIKPYGRVNPEERRRRALELLAQHATQWETQVHKFEQSQSQQQNQKEHKSVMFMDGEWREKQRRLAQQEQKSRKDQTVSWVQSLRFNEKFIEMQLGRINPIKCIRSASENAYALQTLTDMPVYVPIDEKIPIDLVKKKQKNVQINITKDVITQEKERIDIQLDYDPAIELKPLKRIPTMERVSGDVSGFGGFGGGANGERRSMVSAQNSEVEKLAKAIDDQVVIRDTVINKQTYEEPFLLTSSVINPGVMISSLQLNSTTENPAVLRLTNTGDCVLQVELRPKSSQMQRKSSINYQEDLQNALKMMQSGKNFNQSECSPRGNLGSGGSNRLFSQSLTQHTKTALSSLQQISGHKTTTFAQQKAAAFDVVLEQQQSNEATVDDLQLKLNEKSSIPSNLKTLADKFGNLDERKVIVGIRSNYMSIGCGEVVSLKFYMPINENTKPGTIMEEFDLIVSPPVQLYFETNDMTNRVDAHIMEQKTYITLRCNGMNNQILAQTKQLRAWQELGDVVFRDVHTYTMAESIVEGFMREAISSSAEQRTKRHDDQDKRKQISKFLENQVVKTYADTIIQCKWLPNQNCIKQCMYDIFSYCLGAQLSINELYMHKDIVQRFCGEERVLNLDNQKSLFFQVQYFEQAKQQYFRQLLKSKYSPILKLHLEQQNPELTDQYSENLTQMLLKRFINKADMDLSDINIVLDQLQDTDDYLMQYATSTSKVAQAMFAPQHPSMLVTRLINKILTKVLPYVCKQIKINYKLEQININKFFTIISPNRPGYQQNLVQLMYMAAFCAQQKPVWDVFSAEEKGFDWERNQHTFPLKLVLLKHLLVTEQQEQQSNSVIEYIRTSLLNTEINVNLDTDKYDPHDYKLAQLEEVTQWILEKTTINDTNKKSVDSIINDLIWLQHRELQFKQTIQHRVFLQNIFATYQINTIQEIMLEPNSSEEIDQLDKYYQQIFTINDQNKLQQAIQNIATDRQNIEQQRLEKEKAALQNKGKRPGSGQKLTIPKETNLNKTANIVKEANLEITQPIQSNEYDQFETLNDAYKHQYTSERLPSKQANKKDPNAGLKQIDLITKYKGRSFSEFYKQTPINQFINNVIKSNDAKMVFEKLGLPEILVDAVLTAMQLQLFPSHDLFQQQPKCVNIETVKRDEFIQMVNSVMTEQNQQQLKETQKAKIVAKPKPGDVVIDELEAQKQQIGAIFDKYVSKCQYVPLDKMIITNNFDATPNGPLVITDQYPKFNLVYRSQHDHIVTIPQKYNIYLNNDKAVYRPPSKLENDQLKFDICHEMRLKLFRQEFDLFVDSLFTQQVKDAIQDHYDALLTFEDAVLQSEKIDAVRDGRAKPEEVGMTIQEIEEYQKPVHPPVSQHFVEFIEKQKIIEQKIQKQVVILFDQTYGDSAISVYATALIAALNKLRQMALQQYRQQYDDIFSEFQESVNSQIDAKIEMLKSDNLNKLYQICVEISKVFGIQLNYQVVNDSIQQNSNMQFGENKNVNKIDGEFGEIRKFLYDNQEKHKFQYSLYAFMIGASGVFDNSQAKQFEDLNFIPIDNVKLIEQIIKLPTKADIGKKDTAKQTKTTQQVQVIEDKPVEVKQVKKDEDDESEDEEDMMARLPRYLHDVETDVTAQREVFGWLFDNAIERSLNWFEAVEKLPKLVEKASNYIARDFDEFCDK